MRALLRVKKVNKDECIHRRFNGCLEADFVYCILSNGATVRTGTVTYMAYVERSIPLILPFVLLYCTARHPRAENGTGTVSSTTVRTVPAARYGTSTVRTVLTQ